MPLPGWTIEAVKVPLSIREASTHLVSTIHKGRRGSKRRQRRGGRRVRIGRPDPALTPNAGMVAVTELLDRLDVVGSLDAATGPIKVRDRGFGAGELLVGIASAQLAGQDFLVGLDRVRADTAGQLLAPVPGLSSTTAAGLARRCTDVHWRGVETGLAAIHERMLDAAAAAAGGRAV